MSLQLHGTCRSQLVFVSFHLISTSVKPPLLNFKQEDTYVTQGEFLMSLKLTTLGTSSELHTWNVDSEMFVPARNKGRISVEDLDEHLSKRLVRLRQSRSDSNATSPASHNDSSQLARLCVVLKTSLQHFVLGKYSFVVSNRLLISITRPAHQGPVLHAMTHALASVLVYLRVNLVQAPPSSKLCDKAIMLTSIWFHYSKYEDVLIALSAFCHRVCSLPSGSRMFDDVGLLGRGDIPC